MRAKELARIAKGKEHNEATKGANQALQTFKLKEIERQKEQERAIEAYSEKKASQVVSVSCIGLPTQQSVPHACVILFCSTQDLSLLVHQFACV